MASVAALAALYVCSLCAELICNSKPLLLRANGRVYLPFLRHVSENDILGNGVHSAPDYALLAATNGSVRAVFAPVRFGPRDIATSASVEPYRRVRVTVKPVVRSGRIDVRADLSVARQDGAELFTDGIPPTGMSVTNLFPLPPEFIQGLALRFSGAAAPALSATIATPGAEETEISLQPSEARAAPPRTVRIRLRDLRAAKTAPASFLFARRGNGAVPVHGSHSDLDNAPLEVPLEVVHLAAVAAFARRDGRKVLYADTPGVTAVLENVAWPFRPVPGHPMGIDGAGRDVFARVLYGTRTALTFGLLLVAWSLVIGIAAGAAQGYFGGWTDLAGQRFIEIWSALPFLYVMILVGSVFGRSFGLLLFCYGLFNWIGVSYYVRAEFLRLRKRPFVEAAKCQGLGAWRIIRRHILPNALTPVITLLPFNLVGAIASISALDFLGFGLPPLTPSWGELLQQAQQNTSAWWLILYPSLLLFSTMLLTVFVGEGLRDAFDPKPNSRYR